MTKNDCWWKLEKERVAAIRVEIRWTDSRQRGKKFSVSLETCNGKPFSALNTKSRYFWLIFNDESSVRDRFAAIRKHDSSVLVVR